LDVKWSATHCKGSHKITFGANIKISSKGSQFNWKTYAKSDIPIGPHHVIHLMMLVGLKLVFNHLPHPLYLHIWIIFSFVLPCGRLIFFCKAHTKADLIINRMKNTYKSLLETFIWGRFWGEWSLGILGVSWEILAYHLWASFWQVKKSKSCSGCSYCKSRGDWARGERIVGMNY
jgi:hypothetical protein